VKIKGRKKFKIDLIQIEESFGDWLGLDTGHQQSCLLSGRSPHLITSNWIQ